MNRRKLLQTLAFPVGLRALAGTQAKIESLEVFTVHVNRRGNWVLARMRASGGLTGIGEASHGGSDQKVIALMRQFFERFQARGPFGIEAVRQDLAPEMVHGGRPAVVAFGALEQCVWDIQGKILGVPVSDLFGGRLRDRIRNYANINRSTDDRTPDGFARMAAKAAAAGFDAVKLAPFDGMPAHADAAETARWMQTGLDCAAAVRDAIGPRRDLLIDVHSHFDRARGLELARRFEPLNLFWLEEVTPARNLEDLAAVNESARMPTAGGESVLGVAGFYRYISAKAVDIVMPDIKYCGGLLETKKIAAMAEGAGLKAAPHGPASPVGNMAAAQVCAGLPNFLILEFSYGEVPWRAELIEPPEQPDQGRLALSDRPGFGISLNESTLAKHRI